MQAAKMGLPSPGGDRAVRLFILKVAVFISIWGALFFRGEWTRYGYWLAGWVAFLAIGLGKPALFRPIRRALARLGSWVGRALAWMTLAAIYFLVIVPLGLAARVAGKKFLEKGKDASAGTYWIPREALPREKASWERQY